MTIGGLDTLSGHSLLAGLISPHLGAGRREMEKQGCKPIPQLAKTIPACAMLTV